jgi:hypothetical protein
MACRKVSTAGIPPQVGGNYLLVYDSAFWSRVGSVCRQSDIDDTIRKPEHGSVLEKMKGAWGVSLRETAVNFSAGGLGSSVMTASIGSGVGRGEDCIRAVEAFEPNMKVGPIPSRPLPPSPPAEQVRYHGERRQGLIHLPR